MNKIIISKFKKRKQEKRLYVNKNGQYYYKERYVDKNGKPGYKTIYLKLNEKPPQQIVQSKKKINKTYRTRQSRMGQQQQQGYMTKPQSEQEQLSQNQKLLEFYKQILYNHEVLHKEKKNENKEQDIDIRIKDRQLKYKDKLFITQQILQKDQNNQKLQEKEQRYKNKLQSYQNILDQKQIMNEDLQKKQEELEKALKGKFKEKKKILMEQNQQIQQELLQIQQKAMKGELEMKDAQQKHEELQKQLDDSEKQYKNLLLLKQQQLQEIEQAHQDEKNDYLQKIQKMAEDFSDTTSVKQSQHDKEKQEIEQQYDKQKNSLIKENDLKSVQLQDRMAQNMVIPIKNYIQKSIQKNNVKANKIRQILNLTGTMFGQIQNKDNFDTLIKKYEEYLGDVIKDVGDQKLKIAYIQNGKSVEPEDVTIKQLFDKHVKHVKKQTPKLPTFKQMFPLTEEEKKQIEEQNQGLKLQIVSDNQNEKEQDVQQDVRDKKKTNKNKEKGYLGPTLSAQNKQITKGENQQGKDNNNRSKKDDKNKKIVNKQQNVEEKNVEEKNVQEKGVQYDTNDIQAQQQNIQQEEENKDETGTGEKDENAPEALSMAQLLSMISYGIIGDRNDIELVPIYNDKQTIQFDEDKSQIIIFLKTHHYTVCVFDNENPGILQYFNSYGLKDEKQKKRLERDFKQIHQFALNRDPVHHLKFKYNTTNQWQENDQTDIEDQSCCGEYCYIFLHNIFNLDLNFKEATYFSQQDDQILHQLVPWQDHNKFPHI